jgi:cell division protease FtsH
VGSKIIGSLLCGSLPDRWIVKRLCESKVAIAAKPPGDNVPWFVSLFVSWLPFMR